MRQQLVKLWSTWEPCKLHRKVIAAGSMEAMQAVAPGYREHDPEDSYVRYGWRDTWRHKGMLYTIEDAPHPVSSYDPYVWMTPEQREAEFFNAPLRPLIASGVLKAEYEFGCGLCGNETRQTKDGRIFCEACQPNAQVAAEVISTFMEISQ
jgi:hypothetical protein